jgi:hypothetical protein
MTTFKRICIKDWSIEDSEGNRQEFKRGHEYTTSKENEDGTITGFGNNWVRTPPEIWAGAVRFT